MLTPEVVLTLSPSIGSPVASENVVGTTVSDARGPTTPEDRAPVNEKCILGLIGLDRTAHHNFCFFTRRVGWRNLGGHPVLERSMRKVPNRNGPIRYRSNICSHSVDDVEMDFLEYKVGRQ